MNRPTRLGVFGAGQVYRQLYAPALAARPEFRVVGSADPVAPARFRRPEDLLAAAEVDGVIVLSPPALHAEHVGLALARAGDGEAQELVPGKAVYVPGRYAHRSVNVSPDEPLVTFFAFPGHAGHDYGTIETQGFRKLIVERDGKPAFVDNPKWKK